MIAVVLDKIGFILLVSFVLNESEDAYYTYNTNNQDNIGDL